MSAHISFPIPTQELKFSWNSQGRREKFWKVNKKDDKITDEAVYLHKKMDDIAISMQQDTDFLDRIYPMLVLVDAGTWLIHSGYLYPSTENKILLGIDVGDYGTIIGGVGNGWSKGGPYLTGLSDSGYLLVSNRRIALDREFFCGRDMPPWLCEFMKAEGQKIRNWYSTKFSSPFNTSPFLVATWHQNTANNGQSWWRGDVTQTGGISLRFYGERWKVEDEQAKAEVRMFLAHEYFHLWQAKAGASDTLSDIVREGSAEYASLLLARDLGWISETEMHERLLASTNACANVVGARAIRELPSAGSRLVYDCGNLLFWLRSQTMPTYVFDVWRGHNIVAAGNERGEALWTMLTENCEPWHLCANTSTACCLNRIPESGSICMRR